MIEISPLVIIRGSVSNHEELSVVGVIKAKVVVVRAADVKHLSVVEHRSRVSRIGFGRVSVVFRLSNDARNVPPFNSERLREVYGVLAMNVRAVSYL